MKLQVNQQMIQKTNKQKTMKNFIFILLFTFSATLTFSQDLKSAKSDLEKKQLDKAKTEIDAYVAKNPNDAEGNYVKSQIYGLIATTDQFKSLVPGDARQESLDAFKKAMADTNDKKMMLIAIKDQYKPVFDLYTGYYQAGADAFNKAAPAADKAGFADAMNNFIKADNVGHYVAQNKWAKIADVDTTLVLNIGKAALNAGKNDEAVTYFKKLADAKITGTKDGDNAAYELPYQWLTLHYKDAKDDANMMKYANLGKELFPKDDYFDLVLQDYYRDKKDHVSLFKNYETLVGRHPDSLTYHFNYANDIFGYIYNGDEGVVVTDKPALLQTMQQEIEKAHAINPNDVLTNWLYAQYYYNKGIDTRDSALKIKSTKPDDVKNKAALNAASKDNFNKAIPYGESALSTLESSGNKKSQKSRYKSVVDLMEKIYQSLNQNDKVKVYEAKYDAADAKFVN
jgi:hypothetical protein